MVRGRDGDAPTLTFAFLGETGAQNEERLMTVVNMNASSVENALGAVSVTAAPLPTPTQPPEEKHNSNAAAIGGGIAAGILVLGIVIGSVVFMRRRRQLANLDDNPLINDDRDAPSEVSHSQNTVQLHSKRASYANTDYGSAADDSRV
jgi:hypothetical protein